MKPPPFSYSAPRSLDEAQSLLAEHGDEAKVLAGGQSLVPLMALRLARPSMLVDLAKVPGLSDVSEQDGRLSVGAMTRERAAEKSELVRRWAPLMAHALPLIGHPAIRTRGTVGGSLSHADPAAELPAVALALEAELVVSSAARGKRTLAASEFFLGYFTSALEPDEILTEVLVRPPSPGEGSCFSEVARRHGDFAMVGVATSLRVQGGAITQARIALSGVAETPLRIPEAEAVLVGSTAGPESFEAAASAVRSSIDPPADLHGSSSYRKAVAGTLVRRALAEALARATESNGGAA